MDLDKTVVYNQKKQQFVTDIDEMELLGDFIYITYKGNDGTKDYPYKKATLIIDETCQDVTDEGKDTVVRNTIYRNVQKLYYFSKLDCFKIFLENGEVLIEFRKNVRLKQRVEGKTDFFQYLTELSEIEIEKDEKAAEEESFLYKQYHKFNGISQESILFSYMKGRFHKTENRQQLIYPFSFNESQMKAVENAFTSNISIVEGPPGTGKTQTILNMIANIILQNKTVAVVSNNNAAVENVKEKLAYKGLDFFVAELGKGDNRKNFIDNQKPYPDMESWDIENSERCLERLKWLENRIRQLIKDQNRIQTLKYTKSCYLTEQQYFEDIFSCQEFTYIKKLMRYKKSSHRCIEIMADMQVDLTDKERLKFVTRMKWIFKHRVFRLEHLKQQAPELFRSVQKQYYVQKINEIDSEIQVLERKLKAVNFQRCCEEYDELAIRYFKAKLKERFGKKEKREVFKSDTFLGHKFDDFVREYPVILSTTYSICNSKNKNYLFDYIIVDEASQVDLLTAGLALGSCKNIIIVGDEKQLPQIIEYKMKEESNKVFQRYQLKKAYNYAEYSLLTSVKSIYGDSIPVQVLKEHYRCHPKIIGFCNKKYYQNELVVYTDETMSRHPLKIYRTAPGNHMRESIQNGKKSKFNQREIDVISKEVLKEDFHENWNNIELHYKEYGMISPYRKQIEMAEEQISDDVQKDTVHKFQGREKDKIIFSTVIDSKRSGQRGVRFVADPHLINVAVSRAVKEFILVTDSKALTRSNNDITDLIYYVEYYGRDEDSIESEVVSVFDLLYQEYSEKLQELETKVKDMEGYKSENVVEHPLQELLKGSDFSGYKYAKNYQLKDLFRSVDGLSAEEQRFVRKTRSEVDFLIYRDFGNVPLLGIEVDGEKHFLKEQEVRDKKKDSIFKKKGIPLLRYRTIDHVTEERLHEDLMKVIKDRKTVQETLKER